MGKSDTGKINKPIRDALYSVSVAVHKLFHKNGVKQAKLSSNKTMDTLFILAMLAIPIVHFLVFGYTLTLIVCYFHLEELISITVVIILLSKTLYTHGI